MQGPMSVLNVVTIPPGAGLGQRIVMDGFRGAIFEYDVNNNLVGVWASVAGTDPYGNNYSQGLSITGQGIFSGTIVAGSITNTPITGSTITNSDFQGGTMEETVITFDQTGGQLFLYSGTLNSQTFTTTGTTVFNAPAGVTQVTAKCIGAGGHGAPIGGGGPGSGGGGGGGGFAQGIVPVTPGNNYNVIVGAGATAGVGKGGSSSFTGDAGAFVQGNGGTSASDKNGQDGGSGHGSSVFPGGSGGNGSAFASNGGGGGGAGASIGGAGANGAAHNGGTGGLGGIGVNGSGSGGKGGNNGQAGNVGIAPGGGGGGTGSGPQTEGDGARGQVILTWLTGKSLVGVISASTGTDSTGVAFPVGIMLDPVNAPIVAIDPVAKNIAEAWHAIPLASGWTATSGQGTPSYRMGADGRVYLTGTATHASFTTSTPLSTALPAPYRPATRMFLPGALSGDSASDIATTGIISANPGNLASATAWRGNGSYAVNTPP